MPGLLECIICSLPIKKHHVHTTHFEWMHDATLARVLVQAVVLGLQPSHRAQPPREVE